MLRFAATLVVLFSVVIGCTGGRKAGTPSPPEPNTSHEENRQAEPEADQVKSSGIEAVPFLSDGWMPCEERATGVVVDADGRPIVGALVRHHYIEDVIVVDGREGALLAPQAIAMSGGMWFANLFTRTKADGSFVVSPVGSCHKIFGQTLVASAPGFQRQHLVYRGKPLKFVLTPGVDVSAYDTYYRMRAARKRKKQ